MLLKIIKFISSLPTKIIPRISQFILLSSYIMLLISMIAMFRGKLTSLQSLIISYTILLFGLIFFNIMYLSIYYILYEKIDMDKWFEICDRINKVSAKSKVYVLAQLNYYRGNFKHNISYLVSNKLRMLKSINAFNKFMILSILCKCAIMTGNENLFKQSRLELEQQSSKNKRKEKWRVNELAFCDMMYDIVILKEVNDAINTWMPQYPGGKINILERTYFQALNEQLKGNVDRAREYFEQLSKENEDLYFVKEVKKYLDDLVANSDDFTEEAKKVLRDILENPNSTEDQLRAVDYLMK